MPNFLCHNRPSKQLARDRTGGILPLLAITLLVLVILSAFAINIAYLELNRTEMYIASDSASRAAGREFMISNDMNQARIAGRRVASWNPIGGKPLELADTDFVFGESQRSALTSRYTFTPGGLRPNAVEVTARRTESSTNGPLSILIPNPFETKVVNSVQTARSNVTEVDIAIVLDRSGSMAFACDESSQQWVPAAAPEGWNFDGPVPSPSRWREAVAAVDLFLNELTASPLNEHVSLTTYNEGVVIDRNLTSDYQTIRGAMNSYTNYFPEGSTNIGGGISAGSSTFGGNQSRPFASKVMIVLTDGIDTMGSNPILSAEQAAKASIMVFAVTFSDEADQHTMATVAQKGLGKHYHATTGSSLSGVFRDIAKQLPIILSK